MCDFTFYLLIDYISEGINLVLEVPVCIIKNKSFYQFSSSTKLRIKQRLLPLHHIVFVKHEIRDSFSRLSSVHHEGDRLVLCVPEHCPG